MKLTDADKSAIKHALLDHTVMDGADCIGFDLVPLFNDINALLLKSYNEGIKDGFSQSR